MASHQTQELFWRATLPSWAHAVALVMSVQLTVKLPMMRVPNSPCWHEALSPLKGIVCRGEVRAQPDCCDSTTSTVRGPVTLPVENWRNPELVELPFVELPFVELPFVAVPLVAVALADTQRPLPKSWAVSMTCQREKIKGHNNANFGRELGRWLAWETPGGSTKCRVSPGRALTVAG